MGSTEADGTTTLPASGDPNHSVPGASPGAGHAATDGNQSASSAPAPGYDLLEDMRGDDLIEALDWINAELDKGTVVPSDNARSRREILKRQKAEIEARL